MAKEAYRRHGVQGRSCSARSLFEMVPPENVKAVPFEVRLHAGLDPPVVLRFINNTAALDMRLGSVWKANQDPPPADQLPLTIVLPNLHTKCQDELEQIASLILQPLFGLHPM